MSLVKNNELRFTVDEESNAEVPGRERRRESRGRERRRLKSSDRR